MMYEENVIKKLFNPKRDLETRESGAPTAHRGKRDNSALMLTQK